MQPSVYVTTSDLGLGEIAIDGDCAVFTLDLDTLERSRPNDLSAAIDACNLLGAALTTDGLPSELIASVMGTLENHGWYGTRPDISPGRMRPWALITFIDETCASEGVAASVGTTVVYHDWSLWNADLSYGYSDVNIARVRTEIETLGPRGQALGEQCVLGYLAAREAAGLGCVSGGCTGRLDDGEGWDGYCGEHADIIFMHERGEHNVSRRGGCPLCDSQVAAAPVRTTKDQVCDTCGGAIEDDPDGSQGVIVHARGTPPPSGYAGMDAWDLDEDHQPVGADMLGS